MMNTKTFLLTAAAFALTASAAQAQVRMLVYPTSGTEATAFNLDDVTKLTFGESQLFVNAAKTQTAFSFEGVRCIKFDGLTDDISPVISNGETRLKASYANGVITLAGWQGGETRAEVFSLSGYKQLSIARWNGNSISVEALPKGVYLLRINSFTYKFVK